MANTKSAKKAVRSSAKKNKVNTIVKKKFKTARKDFIESVTAKDKKAAGSKLVAAMKSIDKAAKTKTIHKKTAARYKARLARAMNKI
jgi:small subunit ribosomal protein S20